MHRLLVIGLIAMISIASMPAADALPAQTDTDCAHVPVDRNLLTKLQQASPGRTPEAIEATLRTYLLCNGRDLLDQAPAHLDDVWEAVRCVMQGDACRLFGGRATPTPAYVIGFRVPGAEGEGDTAVSCRCNSGGGLQGDTPAAALDPAFPDEASVHDSIGGTPCRCVCGGSNLDEGDPAAVPGLPPLDSPIHGGPFGTPQSPIPDICYPVGTLLQEVAGDLVPDLQQVCAQ